MADDWVYFTALWGLYLTEMETYTVPAVARGFWTECEGWILPASILLAAAVGVCYELRATFGNCSINNRFLSI